MKRNRRENKAREKKIFSLSEQLRLQDELLIREQAGLEKDIERLFKQIRLLDSKHLRIVFIRAARQVISELVPNRHET